MDNIKELYSKFDGNFAAIPSDKNRGKPKPAIQKPYPDNAQLIDLPQDDFATHNVSLFDAIKNRKTHRKFSEASLTINELSFLLWATQGIRSEKNPQYRSVASAGACHPFETYLAIYHITDLSAGLYRYLPIEHKLYFISSDDEIVNKIKLVIPSENPVYKGIDTSAVTFLWTALPYRAIWKYPGMVVKLIAQDSGHLCQNLYLAAEAINSGVCAVDAYLQDKADGFLQIDSKEEFVVYMSVVGKL
ncbi:MAG: SagB/ThcOx family dehydrogenase [Gammaproteobacteria bacterium]|jgi:SagB-type dehydrogenase family enzyme